MEYIVIYWDIFSKFLTPGKLSAGRRPVANWQNSAPRTTTTTNPPPHSAKFVLRVSCVKEKNILCFRVEEKNILLSIGQYEDQH